MAVADFGDATSRNARLERLAYFARLKAYLRQLVAQYLALRVAQVMGLINLKSQRGCSSPISLIVRNSSIVNQTV